MLLIALKYTIQKGDILNDIAANLAKCKGVTEKDIVNFNNIDPNNIQIGEVLKIPNTGMVDTGFRYTVLSGNTVDQIATGIDNAAGISVQDILAANPQVTASNLQVGQVIGLPFANNTQGVIGYWRKTWVSEAPAPPPGANVGIAFSGYANVSEAISNSANVKNELVGSRFISIAGGATTTGYWNVSVLDDLNEAIEAGSFAGYNGIAFDIECGDAGLISNFQATFTNAKKAGFQIIVTVSHSAPFGIVPVVGSGDSQMEVTENLMKALLADGNIDILSPQLYSSGSETSNEYTETWIGSQQVPWTLWQGSKISIMPSILNPAWYPDAQSYFKTNYGITLEGYIIWPPS